MPTSWQPAAQLVTSSHASTEVGLGSDLNGQITRIEDERATIVPADPAVFIFSLDIYVMSSSRRFEFPAFSNTQ